MNITTFYEFCVQSKEAKIKAKTLTSTLLPYMLTWDHWEESLYHLYIRKEDKDRNIVRGQNYT